MNQTPRGLPWRSNFILFVVCALVLSWTSTAALAAGPDFEPGDILVRWGPGVRDRDATATGLGARTVDSIPALGVTRLRVARGREQAVIAALRRAGAQIAEPNHTRRISLVPNDPLYSSQWNMGKINAPSAWDITMGSSSIIVAVIDTGMDIAHPDRPQNLILGADYIVDPTGATPVSGDPHGHGTHVSGIVAARTNNAIGVAGVAPGVSLMAIRVLDAGGSGTTYNTAQGIVYAVDHGARVINLSLSGCDSSTFEEDAVNYAYSRGVMVVAAAGNYFTGGSGCVPDANPPMYPAALPHVVAVAATDSSDNHAYYSETGSYVDLAAPGGGGSFSDAIWSSCRGSLYCQKAGTSMATPHVAGVAALVRSVNSGLTPDQVESILRQSAVDLGSAGRDDVFGYGRVDAYQAMVSTTSISDIPNQAILEDTSLAPVSFTVGGSNPGAASLSAASSNTALVPVSAIVFGGSGITRTVSATPLANQNGSATITVTATLGSDTASDNFTLTVNPVNDPPTLNQPPNRTVFEDSGKSFDYPLTGISAGPVNEAGQALNVTAVSSNPALIPNPAVSYTSPGVSATLAFTPTANASGAVTITVTVQDNGGTASGGVDSVSRAFRVTVTPVNDRPVLNAIAPRYILEDSPQQLVVLRGINSGQPNELSQTLTVTATSSNTALVPNPTVDYISPSATGILNFTPAPQATGVVTITVTVRDNGGTAGGGVDSFNRYFQVYITAVNDQPTLDPVADLNLGQGAGEQTVNLTGITAGPPNEAGQSIAVTAMSSNPELIPNPLVTYASPSATGSLRFTPAPGVSGTATIILMLEDNGGEANGGANLVIRSFNVTVAP